MFKYSYIMDVYLCIYMFKPFWHITVATPGKKKEKLEPWTYEVKTVSLIMELPSENTFRSFVGRLYSRRVLQA